MGKHRGRGGLFRGRAPRPAASRGRHASDQTAKPNRRQAAEEITPADHLAAAEDRQRRRQSP